MNKLSTVFRNSKLFTKLYKIKLNHIGMLGLTIFTNSIAIMLLLINQNPVITFLLASVFLLTPTIIAQIIEGYMQITLEDERRELIIKDASRMTINQYIILAISIGALLMIFSLIGESDGFSSDAFNAVSFAGIIIITSGLLMGWIFAFSMDVQLNIKSGVYPKIKLTDIMLGILSAPLIFLYMNHFAVLFTRSENSVLSDFTNIEQNWFLLFFTLASLNFIVLKIYIANFGPNDEMQEALARVASIFTLKLVTLILLTISLLVLIMHLIEADQDLLWIGIPTFISFILLRSDFLLNINRSTSQFS